MPSVPAYERFREEPFLTLDQALKDIEAALPAHHRIALVFDEFEELETSVKEGRLIEGSFPFCAAGLRAIASFYSSSRGSIPWNR